MSMQRRLRRASRHGQPVPSVKRVDGYEIVYTRLPQPWYDRLPEDAKEALTRLHGLVRHSPRQAVPELLHWIERHPEVPTFYNYLCAAYIALGKRKHATRVIEDNYRRNPGYLFARINYAEARLRERDFAAVREALGPRLELRDLLPGREQFHISEFMGFTYVAGLYHLVTGDLGEARRRYELLTYADPQSDAAEHLGSALALRG